jgi:dolichol kinase
MQMGGYWVGSTAVFWGFILLIVLITSFFRHQSRKAKYRLLEKLADKGQTLSPELLGSLTSNNIRDYERFSNPIGSGIFLMCIGIALAVFFWALGGGGNFFHGENVPNWLPVLGIFPFMIGLARLLSSLTDRRPPK